MKVLLAHRCADEARDEAEAVALPWELPGHAAGLRAAGHSATLANLSRLGWKEAERFLADEKADLTVIWCTTPSRHVSLRLARLARRATSEGVVALAGPHARALPALLLRRSRSLSFVLLGHGETVLPEVCAALETGGPASLPGVAGIAVRGEPVPPPGRAAGALPKLDRLPGWLSGLEAAGLEPERDLSTLRLTWPDGDLAPLRRKPQAVARDVRDLRRRFGVVELAFAGDGLLADPVELRQLAEHLRREENGIAWELSADVRELVPAGTAREARRLEDALLAARRAGCERVRVALDAHALDARPEPDLDEALAAASRSLRRAGIASHLTAWIGTVDRRPAPLDELRRLLRAFRPVEWEVRDRLVLPDASDWPEWQAEHEAEPTFWFDEPQEHVPVRADTAGRKTLEVALREVSRSARVSPRDLEEVSRRLGPVAWAHVGWGDYRAALGDREEAASRYRRAAETEPWNALPWLRLARLARRGARPDKALEEEALSAALAIVPRHSASLERLAALGGPRRGRRREGRRRRARGRTARG